MSLLNFTAQTFYSVAVAKIAQVFIDGEILPENYIWDDDGTSLYRVRKQIEATGEFDSIRLNIFSPGGYCLEGWAIHDYLIGLGKPIDTFTYGQCASFGTILHSMGKTREISPNCDFLLHRPYDFFIGNDLQNEEFQAYLKKETAKIFERYATSTGMSIDELDTFIRDKDIRLTPQETVDKNFSTGIYQPTASAMASMNGLKLRKPSYLLSLKDRKPNPNAPKDLSTNSNNTMAEKKRTLIEAAKALLGFVEGDETKALDVPLKDGRKLVTNSTGDDPVVGDTATIDGATAPDGDYATDQDEVITVKDGVITAITDSSDDTAPDASANDSETIASLKKKNDALEKTNLTLQAKVDSQGQRIDELEKRTKAVLGQFVSQDVPTQANRTPQSKGGKAKTDEDTARDELLARHLSKFAPKQAA